MSADSSLSVALLGEPAAQVGERTVQLGGGLRLAVFSALALREGSDVSRGELISAVWGQHAPAGASGSLHTYVSALRRALDPEDSPGGSVTAISRSRAGYRLALSPERLDIHRLARLRDQAFALRDTGDTDGELAVLEEALSLWRGEALVGVPGPLATAHRARLSEARMTVVERRASLIIAGDGPDEIVDELADLAREHPARESVHGLLMAALFRAGRQTDALEAYRWARAVLVERVGTEPGQELRALHQRILAGDTTVGLLSTGTRTTRRTGTGSDERSPAPFVRRADVVARLHRALADVADGRGDGVWIDGAAGAGKSALLAEALSGDAVAGYTVAWAAGDELSQQVPFHVLDRALDDLGTRLPSVPASPLGPNAGASPAAALEYVRHVVGAHISGPLVLVLDDLQWADRESLVAWHQLRGLADHRPLLLVSASRPLPCRPEMHLIRALSEVRRIELPPLTDDEAHDLVHRVGGHPAPAVEVMVGMAGGNPAYLLAMADAAGRHGHAHEWTTVPAPVAATVTAHVDQLSPRAGLALRGMALLGLTCAVEDVEAATGVPASGLVDAFGELMQGGFLHAAGAGVRFTHPLVRRVLCESVPASLRPMAYRPTGG